MTGGKTISPIRALSEGPAVIAEKALTAEASWPDAERRAAEAITAAGTEAASSAVIFLGNKDAGLLKNHIISSKDRQYGNYRKNNFYNSKTETIRRAYVC